MHQVAQQRKESKRKKDGMNAYVKSLIETWSKAFSSESIMEKKLFLIKPKTDWHCISITFTIDR